MKAYHGKRELKEKVLEEIREHRKADRLVKGVYWENGKGCAVGCLTKGSNHHLYPKKFGIPEWLAHLEDAIFEGLPNGKAMEWPERFLEAIPIGMSDEEYRIVKHKFFLWLLTESKKANTGRNHKTVKDAIKMVADEHRKAIQGKKTDFDVARYAARSAAYSATDAARYAARSVVYSAAYSDTYSAAYIEIADKLVQLLREGRIVDR